MIEAILKVNERRDSIRGYRIISAPAFLQHFTARFEPVKELPCMRIDERHRSTEKLAEVHW